MGEGEEKQTDAGVRDVVDGGGNDNERGQQAEGTMPIRARGYGRS